MNVQLTEGEGLAKTLQITVPAAKVKQTFESRVVAVAKTAKIQGFRPGKVPASVVRQKMGEDLARDVAQELVREALPEAIKQKELNVAGQPRVHNDGPVEGFKVVDGQDFSFKAEVEVYPVVEPKGFDKLKLVRETAEPDESLIDTALSRLQTQMQTFGEKKGKAEKGDKVTFTGQGYVEDEAFEGGNLKDFAVVIGSGQLIPGFEDGLVGVNAGNKVDVKVTFPKEYHAPKLAGKPAVFKLEINKVEAPQGDKLDDATAKKMGFESLDALKDIMRKGAVRELTQASEQRLKRQLLDALDEANKFMLPLGLVEAELKALWQAQLQELQARRQPIESLGSVEEVFAGLKPLAERRVRLGLTLAAVAKAQKIEVAQADIEKAIEDQIAAAGPQADQARAYFANPANRQQLIGPVLEDKVTAWLIAQAEVSEKKVSAQALLAELQ